MNGLNTRDTKMLLLGIGNSGRGDDGLGWKFIEAVTAEDYDFMDYEYRYQLQVEDAALVAYYDLVVFVDACHTPLEEGYELRRCEAVPSGSFTTHEQDPGTILYLANTLYGAFPSAYILAISGKDWEMATTLSAEADANLRRAVAFIREQFLVEV